MDSGAAFTGGAGNDTFNATVATLGALDVIDAGAGTDTLSVVETNSISTWGGASLTGFEIAKVSTTGDIGSIKVTAGTDTAAVAQKAKFTLGAPSAASQTYDVTIGTSKYTTGTAGGTTAGDQWTAIKATLTAHLGDSVTFDDTNYQVISAVAGSPLPSLAIALNSTGTGTASISSTLGSTSKVVNVTSTAPVAVKQSEKIVLSTNPSVGDTFTLSISGADYVVKSSGATVDTAAADIAALINAVLGTGTAVAAATGGTVTITAPVAGTPLPAMNLTSSGATTDAWYQIIANKAANASAATAVALAAPTGVTSYTATATGVANVSGAATTDITVSGTAVQTSVGNNVTVTASDSVFVSGAKGAVVITGGTSSTTLVGAVAADTSTGTAGDAAGIYVTGGTTVTITGTKDSGNVKVGAAPYAKDAVSTTGYPQTNGNSAKTPTGDVSITNVSRTTSTTTGVVDGTYSAGTASVYTNGASTVTVKGAGTTVITDAATQTLKSTAEATAVAGTSKLTTVNLAGLSGGATIKSDAISTISVSDTLSAQTVTVSDSGTTGVNTGAINLQVSNVGTSTARVTLSDATATSVNVSSGAASAYGTVGGTTINSGSKSYITLSTAKATSVTMTNSLAVDIGDVLASAAKVSTVNASGASGAVTATLASTPTQGLTFTGGSGADSVTLKANSDSSAAVQDGVTVKTSISLGAGNDKLLNGGAVGGTSSSGASGADERIATVSSGAVVDGGDGTDTVSVSLINSTNAAQFVNFETLDLKGSVNNTSGAATGSFDASLLTGSTITGLAVSGNLGNYVGQTTNSYGATFTVTKMAGTNIALTTTDTGSAAGSVVAYLANSTGTADSATITYNATSTAADTVSALTLFKTTGIETVSVASGGALGTSTAKVANSLVTFEDASNTTASITITGTQNFKLGAYTNATTYTTGVSQNSAATTATADVASALKTIDGSAATGALTLVAGTTSAQIASTGFYTVYDGLTIKGGAGDDTLVNTAKGGVVLGGDGADTIILTGAGTAAGVNASADGGAGNDTIIVGAGVSTTLTGGAGKDTFDATLAVSSTTGNVITTVTDYVSGVDTIKIVGSNSLVKATTTSGTYAQLLAAADTQAEGNSLACWFQFDGNTYIVGDNSSSDVSVVKLVGLFNLTTSTATTGLIGEA